MLTYAHHTTNNTKTYRTAEGTWRGGGGMGSPDNGYFSAKEVLDFTCLDSIGTLIRNQLMEVYVVNSVSLGRVRLMPIFVVVCGWLVMTMKT